MNGTMTKAQRLHISITMRQQVQCHLVILQLKTLLKVQASQDELAKDITIRGVNFVMQHTHTWIHMGSLLEVIGVWREWKHYSLTEKTSQERIFDRLNDNGKWCNIIRL